MALEELQPKVLAWAEARGILTNSEPKTQCLKTISEVGELADNIAKGRCIRDDIGDILVTLIILSKLCGSDFIAGS